MTLNIHIGALIEQAYSYMWPFLRIGAFMMVMPVVGSSFVPTRVRLLLALALTAVVAPVLQQLPATSPLSLAGVVTVMQEIAIGIAIGFAVQFAFDAITLGGQVIAMSMGLGFAVFLDRARGVSIPVLGQLFLMLGILVFLALDGHLALIGILADSFEFLPIGAGLGRDSFHDLAIWSINVFVFAMKIALPAVSALIVVNLSFGVMSRAAPTLNLFAVGFPVAMLLGFAVIFLSMGTLQENVADLLRKTLETLPDLLR